MNQSLFQMSGQKGWMRRGMQTDSPKKVPDAPCELNLATGQSEQRWSACRRAPGGNCINARRNVFDILSFFKEAMFPRNKICWPPVAPRRSQQRAWIRRQTPNMKCPFSSVRMFVSKLVYRKHQPKMHSQLVSALTYSHLKNLCRPTQECHPYFCLKQL